MDILIYVLLAVVLALAAALVTMLTRRSDARAQSALADTVQRAAIFAGGGLLAMSLSLGLWPIHPYRPAREALSSCDGEG